MASYPKSTTSVALFDCPHVDEFAFDYQKIAKLTYGWRVRVRCPGCGNTVQVVMLAYTPIHGCGADKYQAGEIVEMLPPDPKASDAEAQDMRIEGRRGTDADFAHRC